MKRNNLGRMSLLVLSLSMVLLLLLLGGCGSQPAGEPDVVSPSLSEEIPCNRLHPQFMEQLPKATALVFTNIPIPEDVETTDVSEKQDGSILAWLEEETLYVSTAEHCMHRIVVRICLRNKQNWYPLILQISIHPVLSG